MIKIDKINILAVAIMLYLTGCSMINEQKSSNVSKDKDFEVKAYIEKKLKHNIAKHKIDGVSVSLIKNNHVIYEKGFGYMDKSCTIKAMPSTLYRTASVSKTFTSMAMMKLQDEKKLHIDVPINRYLPLFHFKKYPKSMKNVTIREIMTHHSGIPNISSAYELSDKELNYNEVLHRLSNEYLTAPVGKIYNYSSAGIALLGGVVENVTSQSFSDYMQKNILESLHMKASKFSKIFHRDKGKYQDVSLPTMGLISNVIDLSRYIIIMNNGGKIEKKRRIISKNALNDMLKVQNKNIKLDVGRTVGLGLDIDIQKLGEKYPIYSRIGMIEEHRACVMFMPSEKLGVVILAKGTIDINHIRYLAYNTIIKLWESQTGYRYTPKMNISFKVKLYPTLGYYNMDSVGAIQVYKNNDGTYLAKQLASNETLELKKNIDDSYSLIDNSLHLFTQNPFLGIKLYFTHIDNKDVIVREDKYGNKSIVGFRINTFIIPSSWKKSLGDYRSKSTPLILSLKNHHGYLMRVWKQNDVEIFSEFVKIVNDSDAIIDNMTAQQRITVRRGIKKNAKSFVVHQGIEFIKVDK